MPSNERGRERPGGAPDLLRIQREANQALVLSAIRASEQADDAERAHERAARELDLLRADEQELRTMVELRERLIGIIGHDLRTPLNAILMATGVLAEGPLREVDAELVALILSCGRRMSRMLEQLGDLTRVRLGGGFALELAPTDLGNVCQTIADELRIATPVSVQLSRSGDLRGSWDADRLTQALCNIASNAVEHASPATPVSIAVREEGDDVVVAITNTGACIASELLPEIFSAFRRVGTAAGERSGHLGLGLFVANEIVRAHGGTLQVRSSDGSTTFTARLSRSRP